MYLKKIILPVFACLSVSFSYNLSANEIPHIPEPMVFDLVRGLDSKKGELEVNTLALFKGNSSNHDIEWAPEIEYAIDDGLAIEFELPFENSTLESYKFAGQYTLGYEGKFINEWHSSRKR